MTPQETLREAAEYISEHGWNQGGYCADDGSVCALGAIGMVTGELANGADYCHMGSMFHGTSPGMAANNLLRRFINRISIPMWNDEPGRTAEDVILAMKRAAE